MHPIQILELFSDMDSFSLIDINTSHSYNNDEEEDDAHHDEWEEKASEPQNPFCFINDFLAHFLPNISLSEYKMYPSFNAIEYDGNEQESLTVLRLKHVRLRDINI